MKVKVELNKDQDLPLAVIYTDKMTEEVERAVAFLESSASSGSLIAQQEDRLVIIKPSDVILVRVEGGDTVIYTGKGKYFSRKRLYEIYQQLGQDFMQISKQAVVNLTCLESVEASFNGTMFLRLEHGLSDYIKEAYRITPIKKKLYYGCVLGGRILCTFDGLRINTKMEVLDVMTQFQACMRQVTMPVASSGAATMTAFQVWQPATRTPLAVWIGNLLLD